MSTQCTHTQTTERQGDTYYDTQGHLRVVIHARCANPFCKLYGMTVRTRVEGDDLPQTYTPPFALGGLKP